MMEYSGYTAGPIEFDAEEGTFSGTVAGIRDVIHFEGSTADELRQSFRDSIDVYLASCKADGTEPDRPFSGRFPVRISPALHRKAALHAAEEGLSLNQWVARRIAGATGAG
ncbi:MAG: type II toxin-antitoxin system HicB family antitoxin [Longimicrobiales bacterium]